MTRKVVAGIARSILPALALAFAATQPAQAACKLQQLASVQVEITPNGGVLVPMKINGREVWMALSMSTGMAMVAPAAIAPLGLKTAPFIGRDAFFNGARVTQQVRADSLLLGKADFTDWTLLVSPTPRPLQGYKGRPVVGTLSSMFMNVVDLELDLAARKMSLYKQASCRGDQVYWGGEVTMVKLYRDAGGLLFFPMEVNGKLVETSLNTSDQRSVIDERVTQDFYGFRIGSAGVSTETLPGPNGPRTVGVRPMDLSAKGLGISGVPVSIVGDRGTRCTPTRNGESGGIGFKGCVSIVPMELGTDVLAKLRLYIASRESRIYFTLAAKSDPAAAGGPNGAGPPGAPAADGAAAAGSTGADPAAGAAAAAPAADAGPLPAR